MAFVCVGEASALVPGAGLCVLLCGIEVGVFRVGDEFFALENACPHAGHPLSQGIVEGHVVTCIAHGWDFDLRTGFRPGDDDGFPIPRFPVKLEGGSLFIDLDAPLPVVRAPRRPGGRGGT
ncbi:MAG TPA: Rieske 2Fe-2S domain-containing protein [Myxococcota bacterium]|nr:Rieske 2Fe-2S domain-containing protein [Myxococcota bacterium]